MGVVCRPVNGIDDPPVLVPLKHVVLLFTDDMVVRKALGNKADDAFLAFQVYIGDEVNLALMEDGVLLPIMSFLYSAGFKRQLDRKFEHLSHASHMI